MIICRSRFKWLKQYFIFILTLNRLSWGTLYAFPQFVFISFLIRNVMLSRLNTSTPSVNTLNEICQSQLTIHEGKKKKEKYYTTTNNMQYYWIYHVLFSLFFLSQMSLFRLYCSETTNIMNFELREQRKTFLVP